jgi:hypothetical protein
MRLAGTLVCAVADNDTFIGDHARADNRIRCRAPESTPRLFERATHPPAVCFRLRALRVGGQVDYHFS